MKTLSLVIFITALLICGCHTTTKSVSWIPKVEVSAYDSINRPTSIQLDLVKTEQDIRVPHRAIAQLSVVGPGKNEGILLDALYSRARQIGADAVVQLPPEQPYRGWPASATDQALRLFRVQAISYTGVKTSSPSSTTP